MKTRSVIQPGEGCVREGVSLLKAQYPSTSSQLRCITGSFLHINPLIIILSLIAGGMKWGLAGMVLVIPYLCMLKIIFENIDHFNPLHI